MYGFDFDDIHSSSVLQRMPAKKCATDVAPLAAPDEISSGDHSIGGSFVREQASNERMTAMTTTLVL
jgi:hypothetical protein